MTAQRESEIPAGPTQELERLARLLAELEVRIAGRTDAAAAETLARLGTAERHVLAALAVLGGKTRADAALQPEHLQGSSHTVPIQDLLCFLASTKKSGVLRAETEGERFLLQLQHGAVVYAMGDAPPAGEGLSELLAARGVHSAELLGRLPESRADGAWVEHNLVGTSWISRDLLASAIHQQTRLSFFRLCAAGHMRFRFYEGAEIQNVVPVPQSAMELLIEYSRRVDECAGARTPPSADRRSPALFLRSS